MAKKTSGIAVKASFGKRKVGKAKKHPNKHESAKKYNRQGR